MNECNLLSFLCINESMLTALNVHLFRHYIYRNNHTMIRYRDWATAYMAYFIIRRLFHHDLLNYDQN